MATRIRPNRLEVSDRFPMLGFTVRTDGDAKRFEIAIGTSPDLFGADGKSLRSRSNFYSTRAAGPLPVERGEAVYVLPPEVLARFVGQQKLYYGLAASENGAGKVEVVTMPSSGSPYISISGLTGRSLQRVRLLPNRQRLASDYGKAGSEMDWAGDAMTPGTQPMTPSTAPSPAKNGDAKDATASPAPIHYDDGYGPLPPPVSPPANTSTRPTTQPAAQPAKATALDSDAATDEAVDPVTEAELALFRSSPVSAAALILDSDDVQDAQKYAPAFQDLIRFRVPSSVEASLKARSMSIQRIEDAIGDLNLDLYPIKVTSLPTIGGSQVDSMGLLNYIRTNLNSFVDTDLGEFSPYAASDGTTWASDSPVTAVLKIDLAGPDNAAVVVSAWAVLRGEGRHWRFTTVHTPDTGDHPVSGHREFGYLMDGDGNTILYTRGADRTTGTLETMADTATFFAGDKIWRSFQDKVEAFVNSNGGSAAKSPRFSKRFKWSVTNILIPQAAGASALGAAAGVGSGSSMAKKAKKKDHHMYSTATATERHRYDRHHRKPKTTAQALAAAMPPLPIGQKQPVKLPNARKMTNGEQALIRPAISMMAPWVPGLAKLANAAGLGIAVGPSAGEAFYQGQGVGFILAAPELGVYGQLNLTSAADLATGAVLQVTAFRGGIAEFNGVNYGADISWPEVAGGETIKVLYNGTTVQGICVEMGPDAALEPLKIFNAIDTAATGVLGAQQAQALDEGDQAPDDQDQYALSPGLPPRARALEGPGAEIAMKIGEAFVKTVFETEGSITWQLDQLRGLKHPNDKAPDPPAPFKDAETIKLDETPWIDAAHIDRISAWFSIDWQYNGVSLGNVVITNIGTNTALLWKLNVEAKIMDDSIVYSSNSDPSKNCAALKIRLTYRFSRKIFSDKIWVTNVHLYGDGTKEWSGDWVQNDTF